MWLYKGVGLYLSEIDIDSMSHLLFIQIYLFVNYFIYMLIFFVF